MILHSRFGITDTLQQAQQAQDSQKAEVLRETLRYIEEDYGPTLDSFQSYVSDGWITYDLLDLLIPPNTLIYRYHQLTEQPQILLARHTSYEDDLLNIRCDVVSFDGVEFGLATTCLGIKEFQDACKIQDLDVYPFQYHPDYKDLHPRLIERGRKYATMTGYTYGYVLSGPAMHETSSGLLARYEKFHVRVFVLWSRHCPLRIRVER